MSIQTTLKRVSLVAVAAVGIGLLSAIPSNAASIADSFTTAAGSSTAATTGTTSVASTLDTVWSALANPGDTATVTASLTSSPITSTASAITFAQTSGATQTNVVGYTTTGGTEGWAAGTAGTPARTTEYTTASFTPDVPGTYVIKLQSAGGANNAAVTWTITVAAPIYNHSTAFISTSTGSQATADTTSISVPATQSSTPVARITVKQYSTSDTTTALSSANTTAVTASISGAGSVGPVSSPGAAGPSSTIAAGSANPAEFYVYANGVAGTGTITITVNGSLVSTKTVTFYGSFAKFSIGTPSNSVIGVGKTGTVVVTAQDANGNTASLPAGFTVTSGSPTVATVSTSNTTTDSTITITGVSVGTSVITVANAATSPTVTSTFTVTVGKSTIKTLTMTTDKTSYAAGEKITLTVKALGSDGLPVGDGTYAAFDSNGVTSNFAVQGNLPGTNVTFTNGVATYIIYAPSANATVTLTGTEGAATDSTTKGTVSTSFTVGSSSGTTDGEQAAIDAANAATDAANYAADAADAATTAAQEATAAAQAAQDSADAATAAVVALGLRVNVLMASVRAQLTSLSNLLVRIIKKTHA